MTQVLRLWDNLHKHNASTPCHCNSFNVHTHKSHSCNCFTPQFSHMVLKMLTHSRIDSLPLPKPSRHLHWIVNFGGLIPLPPKLRACLHCSVVNSLYSTSTSQFPTKFLPFTPLVSFTFCLCFSHPNPEVVLLGAQRLVLHMGTSFCLQVSKSGKSTSKSRLHSSWHQRYQTLHSS